ncbi:PREDICTED: peroxidase 5-like [Fragaria vesca subsp. vesca]|uniref:peroxidase 5-like n=1 Tax=Fragaria vesca subsp. vesca TaxID=101020 RepID=UPI0002C32994|nr:PREDICTED: peroxidase 5-like [Fragaria vesca subsp. vesca]
MEICHRPIAAIILIFTLFANIILPSEARGQGLGNDLHVGFYSKTCPQVEDIVSDVVKRFQAQDPKLPPALLRLFFHDCFVKGCDASILLDATPSGQPVEKLSEANGKTLRGLEVIDEIKAELEKSCPRTVSCADIIAYAAREAVALAGLPRHDVPAGRRDSTTSRATDADVSLPTPTMPLQQIIGIFNQRNFSLEDIVVMSGAHSIGESQCNQVNRRIYTFAPNVPRDPALDPAYADELAQKCPAQVPPDQELNFKVNLDPVTPEVLDNQYYLNLQQKKGLFRSDQALATDPGTQEIVNQMAASNEAWTKRFIKNMIKMGRSQVLTRDEGEIRLNCREFNKEPDRIDNA